MAGPGGKTCADASLTEIPLVVLTMHIGPFLKSTDLLTLCATQSVLWANGKLFAGWLAALQHGVDASAVNHIKELMQLEGVPDACFLDFTSAYFLKEFNVQLLCGSQMAYPIFVGSTYDAITTAVNPPARGDSWTVSVDLQKGRYHVTLVAWRNPFHGILDLWLDDRLISGHGLDCYSTETAERHSFRAIEIEIERTGRHIWRFETSRSYKQSGHYWMCLEELRIEPVGVSLSDCIAARTAAELTASQRPPDFRCSRS